jgi:hypothetical protein
MMITVTEVAGMMVGFFALGMMAGAVLQSWFQRKIRESSIDRKLDAIRHPEPVE